MTSDDLSRRFRYDAWANGMTLRAVLAASAAAPPRTVAKLAHLFGAQLVWLARLGAEVGPTAVWPDWTAARCAAEAPRVATLWSAWLARGADERQRVVEYVNSKGERFRDRAHDIATHVLLHSAYHRGQIATELRAAGAEPPLTDFIHAVRTGAFEAGGDADGAG